MPHATPIMPEQIRNIRHSTFGWIDHNFLHHGFLQALSQHELLLYFFLILVADRNGVSFYDYQRICQYLNLELDDYIQARDGLCNRSLITQHNGVFQVLPLPKPVKTAQESNRPPDRSSAGDAQSLRAIFQQLSDE